MRNISIMLALIPLYATTSYAAPDAAKVYGDLRVDGIVFNLDGSNMQTKASPWSFKSLTTDIFYNATGTGNVGIGNAAPSEKLDVSGTVLGTNATGTGVKGVSTSGHGVVGTSTSNVAVLGIHDNAALDVGAQAGVFGTSVTGFGVYGQSESSYGIYGVSSSGDGVFGQSTKGYAGYFIGNVNSTGKVSATSFQGNGSLLTNISTTNFSGSLAGDVTGTQENTSVTKIQSIPVSNSTPAIGNTLTFDVLLGFLQYQHHLQFCTVHELKQV
jgi:hypothetical protein